MKAPPKGMHYVHMGAFPIFVGFTCDRNAFVREMKRLGVKAPPPFLGSNHAHATTHELEASIGLTCIITFDAQTAKKQSLAQAVALLAHEAVHVLQKLKSYIGEHNPGAEFEAYTVQWVTQFCVEKYLNRGRS